MSAWTSAPGQAGAIQPVKVRPRQGRSGPPGSECCAAGGDGGREAYTAVMWGVGMSHERHNIVGAEMGFGQGAARMMRWMRSLSESAAQR